MSEKNPEQREPERKPNLLQVIWSVLAALFGVQSASNRERDFNRGKASDYIAVYVVLVIALVAGVAVVVSMVLSGVS